MKVERKTLIGLILYLFVLFGSLVGLYMIENYLMMLVSGILLSIVLFFSMLMNNILYQDLDNLKYMNTELSKRLMEMMK